MVLTARQKEFLDALEELGKNKRGVHYTEVASHLGVSKWTAYDILSEMAEKGYVRVKRVKKGSSKGRAKVLFFPEEKEQCSNFWEHYLDELHEKDYHALLKDIMNDLKTVTNPVTFCMGAILLFLLFLKAINPGNNAAMPVGFLMSVLSSSEVALLIFSGLIANFVLHHETEGELSFNLIEELSLKGEEFKISDDDFREELKSFSEKLMAKLWPKTVNDEAVKA